MSLNRFRVIPSCRYGTVFSSHRSLKFSIPQFPIPNRSILPSPNSSIQSIILPFYSETKIRIHPKEAPNPKNQKKKKKPTQKNQKKIEFNHPFYPIQSQLLYSSVHQIINTNETRQEPAITSPHPAYMSHTQCNVAKSVVALYALSDHAADPPLSSI